MTAAAVPAEVERELLTSARHEPDTLASIDSSGLYAWWDEGEALAPFWPAGFPTVDSAQPLYVGIARGTFAQRAALMHLASTRMSSLRRSLAALLWEELDLLPGALAFPAGKLSLADPAEQRLTNWMQQHLRVSIVEHATPGLVEGAIIGTLLPPLNDTHATHGAFRAPMRAARKALHERIAAL